MNFTPAVWVRTVFILKVREAAVDPEKVRGFRESVLNQTNTVEFLPLLVQRLE